MAVLVRSLRIERINRYWRGLTADAADLKDSMTTTSQNNSKSDRGSIENGYAAFDLPPQGSKKERWAISCPYAYIGPWRGSYRTLSGIDVDVGRRGMEGMDMMELEIR